MAVGLARRRSDRATTLASALVLAAATPSALWLSASLVPLPESGTPPLPLVYFGLTGALAVGGVVGLARLESR